MATVQPMGHAHQMPMGEPVQPERRKARATRRIRSVKVAAINCPMALTPRRMPSAASLADTTK